MSGVHGGDEFEFGRLKEVGAVQPAPPLEIVLENVADSEPPVPPKQAPPFNA